MDCPICSGPVSHYSDTSYFKKPVYLCEQCQLYISVDDPAIYRSEYWSESARSKLLELFKADVTEMSYRRYLLESQLAYCKPFINGKKLLEVGAGSGQMLYMLEQKGFDVTGIEPDPRNVEFINHQLSETRCIGGYAEEISFTESYDVI